MSTADAEKSRLPKTKRTPKTEEFKNPLPQTGWVMDVSLADAIGVSRETLLDWLKEYAIPHRRPGIRAIIHMDDFFEHLPDGLLDGKTESPEKPKRSR